MTTADLYLDYQAITPLDERALEAMLPCVGLRQCGLLQLSTVP